MPELEALVVDIPPKLDQLGAVAVWEEMERGMPEAFQPFLDALAGEAPVGKTGKLAGGGFGIRMRRRSQGLIQGLDVQVGAAAPYTHLVAEGHEIIPRGAGRAAAAGTFADPDASGADLLGLLNDVGVERFQEILQAEKLGQKARVRGRKKERRAAMRANLRVRREAGAIGFVPGNPFVIETFAEHRAGIVARLEQQLEGTFGR